MDIPPLKKPLKRSTSNKVIAGICGGIAEWLDCDPTAIRAAYVLLASLSVGMPALLAYLILWVVIPKDNGSQLKKEKL